jgi:hypothetical protein
LKNLTEERLMDVRRRAAATVLVLLAALASPLTSFVPANAATATWHGPHHIPQPTPVVGRNISCPTASWCMAVDDYGQAQRFNGRRWNTPVPATHHYGGLSGVSCPAKRFCMAVGPYHYLIHRPSGWSRPQALDLQASAVSCTSASFCLAAGHSGHSLRWNGHRWVNAGTIKVGNVVERLSCGAPTMCLASGDTGRTARYGRHGWRSAGSPFADVRLNTRGVALSCVSPTWCLGASVEPFPHRWAVYDGHGWHASHPLTGTGDVSAVSCVSRGFCVVVSDGQAVTWRGSGAGRARAVETELVPEAVACGAVGTCVLSGYSNVPGALWDDHSYALRNRAWHRLNDTHTTDPDRGAAVSCPSASWCMLATGSRRTWVHDAGSWSRVMLPADASSTQTSGAERVSCSSSSFCALLQDQQFQVWNGTAWSTGVAVPGATWTDVACASSSMCLAVGEDINDEDGFASEWDGTSWGPATAVPSSELETVSCPAVDHCVAGDLRGSAWTLDQGTWTQTQAVVTDDGDADMTDMSCPTTTFCMVYDGISGTVGVLDHGSWHRVDAPRGFFVSLSCGRAGSCVLATDNLDRTDSWHYSVATGFSGRERLEPPAYAPSPVLLSCSGRTHCLAFDGDSTFERK